ncbi:MAG: class II SORL domain-containing protein [Coriobacteriales bacterium]|jgi:desulfoferrodoxin-like iron-binding protein|nr:class II SORL domain-containing protein [Coriobacteriales bacterium]
MSDSVEFENAVTEINEGVVQEVHSIEDIDTASDFELKHTPKIDLEELASGQRIKVTIGLKGITHPQTEEHFIEWIRLFVGPEPIGERVFGPADEPVAVFEIERSSEQVIAQALCNLHGLWEARV